MFHLVARTLNRAPLFHDDFDAMRLWSLLTCTPGLVALCLMPDHLHLQVSTAVDLRAALSGYTQYFNHRHRRDGPLLQRRPAAQSLADAQKERRSERYIHLNPCRARLVSCPLAWPWSTHRDAVGLSLRTVRERAFHPGKYHRYTSSDPHAAQEGTPWPTNQVADPCDPSTAGLVRDAVSSLLRVPLPELAKRTRGRQLWVQTLRAHSGLNTRKIADAVGVTSRSVRRTPSIVDRNTRLVWSVTGDPRFRPIYEDHRPRSASPPRTWIERPHTRPNSAHSAFLRRTNHHAR